MDYSEFKEKVCTDLKQYFQEPQLKKQNIEVVIQEQKDNYETSQDILSLWNRANSEQQFPDYNLFLIYETYKRSQDADKVIHALADLMEKQYLESVIVQNVQETKESFQTTTACMVTLIGGDKEQEISDIYMLVTSESSIKNSLPFCDDTLVELAEKEDAHLLLLPVAEDTLLAVPVQNIDDYKESLEIMEELQRVGMQVKQDMEISVYDKGKNLLLVEAEEMEHLLSQEKGKKRSIFSK